MSATGDAFMVESHRGTVCGNFTLVDVGNVRSADRRGLLMADPEYPSLDLVPGSSLDHLQGSPGSKAKTPRR